MKFHANTKSKKLLLVLGAILTVAVIVATTVFTTVAYLTSTSYVINTFTIGNVGIRLSESKVNSDGTLVDGGQTQVSENNYHLVPNKTYVKDPTITVTQGSEESFLFIIIHNGIEGIECDATGHTHKTIEQQLRDNGWMPIQERTAGTVYCYIGNNKNKAKGVTATNAAVKVNLFKDFTISSEDTATLNTYSNADITINAFAIQAATLTASQSWEVLAEQYVHLVGAVVDKDSEGNALNFEASIAGWENPNYEKVKDRDTDGDGKVDGDIAANGGNIVPSTGTEGNT